MVNADLEISRGVEQSSRGGQHGGEIKGLLRLRGSINMLGVRGKPVITAIQQIAFFMPGSRSRV